MQTKNNLFQKYYPFWNNLSESEKEQFKTYSGTKTFKKGENINRTDECAGFVLIKSGQIRIYIVSEEGREVTLYRLSEGNICIFTAQCVLDSISFDVIVEAEQDTELMILSPGRFHAVSEKIFSSNALVMNLPQNGFLTPCGHCSKCFSCVRTSVWHCFFAKR